MVEMATLSSTGVAVLAFVASVQDSAAWVASLEEQKVFEALD
jgi:hypothetical protein